MRNHLLNNVKNEGVIVKGKMKKYIPENKVPFPEPVGMAVETHRSTEAIFGVLAVVFIAFIIGLSSQAPSITGAAVGANSSELQFLGLGGVAALVVILFALLYAKGVRKDN
tara:strand:+ start:303 stop:635 length:333 start_codon:yes stop_codon:yes gene_type:complete